MNSYLKKYCWSIIGLLFSYSCFSQSDPMFTMYFQNMQLFNPAYAGSWQSVGFTSLNRIQWLGVKGHPSTQALSVQAPLQSQNIGLGFNFMFDKIGLERRLAVNLDYSYRIELNAQTSLRLGLKGGFTNYSNPLPFYTTYESGDPNYFMELNSKMVPNFGAGAYLSNDGAYLGLSVPRFLAAKYTPGENFTITDYPAFYASGGLVLNVAEDVKFKPAFLTRMAERSPFQYDLTANFLFKEKFWIGAMYRSGDAVGINTQWIFKQKLRIGYAYDITVTDLQRYQNGVHEIMISYELDYLTRRYVSPRYF